MNTSDPQGRSLRLLVIDDDALNRTMMKIMLEPEGYGLEFASNGAEALEAVEARQFDLVFLDLILPDMNGRDVARKIRERENGSPHLPIIAVTAYDLPGQPLELVKAGIDDYVFKPFSQRSLTRMIRLYANRETEVAIGADTLEPTTAVSVPVLDYRGSLIDFSNDVAGYQELLRDFTAALPGRIAKLHRALEAGDVERMGRECHSLKGVAAGLGAMRLSVLATRLGKSCAAADAAGSTQLLAQVEAGAADLQAEVRLVLEPQRLGERTPTYEISEEIS